MPPLITNVLVPVPATIVLNLNLSFVASPSMANDSPGNAEQDPVPQTSYELAIADAIGKAISNSTAPAAVGTMVTVPPKVIISPTC